ncbi:hypothetical protein CDD83_1177 [Cordyceps sp. RAO-2017]|nr:hypothetical protein CDD83_1177 [Cordyceps sp. RAO-2017]
MPSRDLLRLRVSVQRHGVPDVKLVWPCERSDDLTVSKFLAQISQVIPLEGGEWGLEDYVVELADGLGGTYECLHFQPISQILQSDDQVLIRCLQGEDLKRRRLNGRHQITSDGKHLIDGLVFGRPWLRSPRDRPALELPPRKRVRTALDYDGYGHFDDEDEENEAREPRLLPEGPLLLAGTDEDDESFIESEEEEQDAKRLRTNSDC